MSRFYSPLFRAHRSPQVSRSRGGRRYSSGGKGDQISSGRSRDLPEYPHPFPGGSSGRRGLVGHGFSVQIPHCRSGLAEQGSRRQAGSDHPVYPLQYMHQNPLAAFRNPLCGKSQGWKRAVYPRLLPARWAPEIVPPAIPQTDHSALPHPPRLLHFRVFKNLTQRPDWAVPQKQWART